MIVCLARHCRVSLSHLGHRDLVQAVLLMYIAALLPYRIGFNDNVQLWSFFFFLDLCIDIYFIFDLYLNFRTAVVTLDGELMFTRKEVARNYLRGWFLVDFISCLPFSCVYHPPPPASFFSPTDLG